MKRSIYVGFDPREIAAYLVAVNSIARHLSTPIPIKALYLPELVRRGLYCRPMTVLDKGILFDPISGFQMSTEFAISRFLVPHVAKTGWALFVDCDVLSLVDLVELFELADPRYAVMCVKHNHVPQNETKMDGRAQDKYSKKNWSSVCLWNCDHPANKGLTLEMINELPGRLLHSFCWLKDEEIGELPQAYNYLVGYTESTEVRILHYTEGTPHMPGHEDCEYNALWRAELALTTPTLLRALGTLPA